MKMDTKNVGILRRLLTQADIERREVCMLAIAYAVVLKKMIPVEDPYMKSKEITNMFCEIAILDRVRLDGHIKNMLSFFNINNTSNATDVLSGNTSMDYFFINRYIGADSLILIDNQPILFKEVVLAVITAINDLSIEG